ncbi:MAG TPA: hypothetical protein VLI39_01710 [Sedimentisphaerales bacterium]|nr:hypothetical protein [Sedimentisphaerales bacterium]
MTESYPSDNELLNLQSDPETGVEYIPTGAAPYYLHFRKLLHRLLLAVRRANDLRVCDEGGLDIGVKPGKFWLGADLVTFSGSTGNALADDKDAIYVYLDRQGNLVTNEYAGFPIMAATPHVRLAVVSTTDGDIVSIADCRDAHNVVVPCVAGGVRRTVETHTTGDLLDATESGSVHTNLGAAGAVTLTLPDAPPAGTEFTFAVQAACELRIEPGDAAIRDNSGQTAGKYKAASAIGAALTIVADSNGNWAVTAKTGTWTEEP